MQVLSDEKGCESGDGSTRDYIKGEGGEGGEKERERVREQRKDQPFPDTNPSALNRAEPSRDFLRFAHDQTRASFRGTLVDI